MAIKMCSTNLITNYFPLIRTKRAFVYSLTGKKEDFLLFTYRLIECEHANKENKTLRLYALATCHL